MRTRLVVVMAGVVGAVIAVGAGMATADEPAPGPTDGAGIPNTNDACPDEPIAQRRAGCPTHVTVCADCDVGPLTVRISYGPTQVHPQRGDWPVLRAVADVMLAHPELRVRVEGHSDSRGTEVRQQSISERRAVAVVRWLVRAGIASERLTPVGYGATRPLEPHARDESGHARNRRVEFELDTPASAPAR